MPLVFTPNFLRCLSNNLTKQDNYLHSTAKKCLDRITAFAGGQGRAAKGQVVQGLRCLGGWMVQAEVHIALGCRSLGASWCLCSEHVSLLVRGHEQAASATLRGRPAACLALVQSVRSPACASQSHWRCSGMVVLGSRS